MRIRGGKETGSWSSDIQFFNSAPVLPLPIEKAFGGVGVYALYYTGREGVYGSYGTEINAYEYNEPIFVGKVESAGALVCGGDANLYQCLRELERRISAATSLEITDFHCRYVICKGDAMARIRAFEAALVARYHPLWNTLVDGFASHNPRVVCDKSLCTKWDVLHSGPLRVGVKESGLSARNILEKRIKDYLELRIKYYVGR